MIKKLAKLKHYKNFLKKQIKYTFRCKNVLPIYMNYLSFFGDGLFEHMQEQPVFSTHTNFKPCFANISSKRSELVLTFFWLLVFFIFLPPYVTNP